MRKTKKFKEMLIIENYTVIYEKIKNDLNGNPRYEVTVFDGGYHKGTFNVVTYTIEKTIENLIESL